MPSFAASFSPSLLKGMHLCGNGPEVAEEGSRPTEQREPRCIRTHYRSLFIEKQWAYAQYLKLMALFVIAISHVLYMRSFLDALSALVDYADVVDMTATASQSYPLRHQIELMADYRKNMWMTVGSMCVALSTSCFFLLLSISAQSAAYIVAMRVVDLVAFSTLPALLLARCMLVERIAEHLPAVLHRVQHIAPPTQLASALHCSLTLNDNMPDCPTVILESLFPVFLIKYLIVLAVLTMAYIILAYIIEWCLRHFFPPSDQHYRTPPPAYTPIILTQ